MTPADPTTSGARRRVRRIEKMGHLSIADWRAVMQFLEPKVRARDARTVARARALACGAEAPPGEGTPRTQECA